MQAIRSILLAFLVFFLISSRCISQSTSWYKCYIGNIDKYPVTLHLHKAGHDYTGYYYYNSRQQPIYFSGEDTTDAAHIKLSCFIPDKEANEGFSFSIKGKIADGKWSSGNAKELIFSAREDSTALTFDYIYTNGSALLRPKLEESPAGTFYTASVWPKGTTVQILFLKRLISGELDEEPTTDDIGKTFLRQKKKFFAVYNEDYKNMKDEELKGAYSYNSDMTNNLMVCYKSSKLIVFASFFYSYTGGAHGNYSTDYIPVDLTANKRLVVGDILNKTGQAKLSELLAKSFRKQYNLKDNEPLTEGGLFDDKIEPNSNFYVTSKGIGFCYNPYEIGPYAMGEINIYISFSELTAYLQPAFKKLIQ